MTKIIVAIDGYSACGKSTTAKLVAAQLGYGYVDTGAMYRAVTLFFLENYVVSTNLKGVQQALNNIRISFVYNPKTSLSEVFLNGQNVEEEIRKMYVSERVSEVSALPDVRHALVRQQQEMGRKKGLVMDGRDIGTRVFPDAELKIFMTADVLVRAQRRQEELLARDQPVDLEDIIHNLTTRDHVDTTRAESPLAQAPDAHLLDTSRLTIAQQVQFIITLAHQRIGANPH